MKNEIKALELKVDTLQKTLEWMIEGMINAQSIKGISKIIDKPIFNENPLEEKVKERTYN